MRHDVFARTLLVLLLLPVSEAAGGRIELGLLN
jgi:hypothetical protein